MKGLYTDMDNFQEITEDKNRIFFNATDGFTGLTLSYLSSLKEAFPERDIVGMLEQMSDAIKKTKTGLWHTDYTEMIKGFITEALPKKDNNLKNYRLIMDMLDQYCGDELPENIVCDNYLPASENALALLCEVGLAEPTEKYRLEYRLKYDELEKRKKLNE